MTGLRLDTAIGTISKRLATLRGKLSASSFKPELERFTARTLSDCIAATPVRNEALITRNQQQQYRNRINYIPSVHTLENPSLIVNEQGESWVFVDDKWYNSEWRLPARVFAAFSELNEERNRRIQTTQAQFINERKQARFLYQRSWWQVAQSLGLTISVAAAVVASHTRRKPAKEPMKAYGQWRGGGRVLSVVIVNKFLDAVGKYWKGNGKAILAQATARNRARFLKECEDKVKREISAARQSA
jgi:hypothetical protein